VIDFEVIVHSITSGVPAPSISHFGEVAIAAAVKDTSSFSGSVNSTTAPIGISVLGYTRMSSFESVLETVDGVTCIIEE
jgi:hypothetical protein